jgi:cellulose synthase/poly-beta-1,6-N-acetylglucosamine synthase-like glycosyltransferase
MKQSSDRFTGTLILPSMVVGSAWIVSLIGAFHIDPFVYAIASSIYCFDLIDLLFRVYRRRNSRRKAQARAVTSIVVHEGSAGPAISRLPMQPYALIFSVHNLEREIDRFIEVTRPYQDRTWIVDDCSTDNTALRLRNAGWRCLELSANVKKPAAIKALLERLPREIHTVLVLDPDSFITAERHAPWTQLEECVRDFQASGAAGMCPRLQVVGETLLEQLQTLEYALSFCLGRQSMGDLTTTSGLAMYRRDALQWALARHSLSVYAEDLENTVLLLGKGETIYYDDRLIIETEGKRTLQGLFSQRVGWSFGLLKVFLERRREIWRAAVRRPAGFYQYMIYLGGISVAALPLKFAGGVLLILSLANGIDELLGTHWIPNNSMTNPLLFTLVYIQYFLLVIVAALLALPRHLALRCLWRAPFYLFYIAMQLVPMTVGYLNWLSYVLLGRRLYADHYDATLERRAT